MVEKLVKYAVIGIVALILISILNPFVVIGPGERGVVMNFGAVQKDILGEGLHWRWPIMQRVVIMDVRVQKGEGQGVPQYRLASSVLGQINKYGEGPPSLLAHSVL